MKRRPLSVTIAAAAVIAALTISAPPVAASDWGRSAAGAAPANTAADVSITQLGCNKKPRRLGRVSTLKRCPGKKKH